MPVLLTPDIIAATRQPVAGWTLLELREYKKKPAKNQHGQGTTDDFYIFDCITGPGHTEENVGRNFTVVISGNALLPGSTVPKVAKTLTGLIIALTELTESELVGKDISVERLYGTRVWCEIVDETYQGNTQKRANCFTPGNIIPF